MGGIFVGIGLSDVEGKTSERVWICARERSGLTREVAEVFWMGERSQRRTKRKGRRDELTFLSQNKSSSALIDLISTVPP